MSAGGAALAMTMGLWFLWMLVVTTAQQVEVAPRRCLLSHYRSLDPKVLKAALALRDSYVSDKQPHPGRRAASSSPRTLSSARDVPALPTETGSQLRIHTTGRSASAGYPGLGDPVQGRKGVPRGLWPRSAFEGRVGWCGHDAERAAFGVGL